MAATLPILASVKERLLRQIDQFSVELFPDNLDNYFVRDECGTILVQYAGSTFEPSASSDVMNQRRLVQIALTVIARSQHDDSGALAILDKVRLALVGFRPDNCTPCHLLSERFIGEDSGLWQYQLLIQTESRQVALTEPQNLPRFSTALYRRADEKADENVEQHENENL